MSSTTTPVPAKKNTKEAAPVAPKHYLPLPTDMGTLRSNRNFVAALLAVEDADLTLMWEILQRVQKTYVTDATVITMTNDPYLPADGKDHTLDLDISSTGAHSARPKTPDGIAAMIHAGTPRQLNKGEGVVPATTMITVCNLAFEASTNTQAATLFGMANDVGAKKRVLDDECRELIADGKELGPTIEKQLGTLGDIFQQSSAQYNISVWKKMIQDPSTFGIAYQNTSLPTDYCFQMDQPSGQMDHLLFQAAAIAPDQIAFIFRYYADFDLAHVPGDFDTLAKEWTECRLMNLAVLKGSLERVTADPKLPVDDWPLPTRHLITIPFTLHVSELTSFMETCITLRYKLRAYVSQHLETETANGVVVAKTDD